MDIYNNEMTLKIDRVNAWGMIEGFRKNNEHYYTSIYTASKNSWSLKGNFKKRVYCKNPKVITLSKNIRSDYSPNITIINQVSFENYQHKYKYVAFIDRIFCIENNIDIWKKLCNNGVFDIWKPSAPNNSLNDEITLTEKEKPMILLLRIFEVDHDYSKDIKFTNLRADKVSRTKINLIRPVIPQNKNDPNRVNFKGTYYFDDIIEIIRKSLDGTQYKVKIVNDTSSIPFLYPNN
jgi:hypothetical protein